MKFGVTKRKQYITMGGNEKKKENIKMHYRVMATMVDFNLPQNPKNNHRKDKVFHFDFQIYLRAADITVWLRLQHSDLLLDIEIFN